MARTWKRKSPEVKSLAETNLTEIGITKMPGMEMIGKMVTPINRMMAGRIKGGMATMMTRSTRLPQRPNSVRPTQLDGRPKLKPRAIDKLVVISSSRHNAGNEVSTRGHN